MELQTTEIKIAASEFNRTINFYCTFFNLDITSKSDRIALLGNGERKIKIESIEDELAYSNGTQVILAKCQNLFSIAEYLDTFQFPYQLCDAAWSTYLVLEDPAGNVCQISEVSDTVGNNSINIAA